ncbi:MAG: polysaccharide deacetylase family protein [Solibacillus sp.]|uniref:polysaccharide deacetylase family protein n=1 Tax=unclassified Solibacillus TaxID=2637870 RepID=UPI0030F83D65
MNKTPRKRRGPWIDLLLISTIFILGTAIVYLTVLSEEPIFSMKEDTFTEATSNISEEESSFPGVRIVTDISNDEKMPFAIQYPLTKFESFNEVILAYIEASKDYYISTMRLQDVKEHTGELNISFETYEHDHYYSFVLTNKTVLNNEEHQTTVQTFLIDHETGELFNMQTLLNDDLKSLETLATHIQSDIEKNPKFEGQILEQQLKKATEPKWELFQRFSLQEESLVIYFDEGEITKSQAGLPTVEISLSFINPLLSADFQIGMQAGETIQPPKELDPTKKHIALTFDDGPHPQVTKQILSLLAKYDAKATFFMLGSRVQYYPHLVVEIRQSGHEIGNHSWTHPVLTKMSAADIKKEFESTEQAIVNAIGENSTLFRPPYGAIDDSVRAIIPRQSINWTIDTLDWKHRDPSSLLPMIQKSLHNNAIVLMHDIHQSTADGLEPVLKYLQSEGYEFVTVSEILQLHEK